MAHPISIGQTLAGRYRLQSLIGQGGMSSVYLAYDSNLDRLVAVKVIHPHLAADSEFIQRFEREAKVIATLRHPNIIQVSDFSHDGENYYMVLEYLQGETLQAKLKSLAAGRGYALDTTLRIMVALCDAINYAHQRGMIHRDLKPGNVMILQNGEPIVMDFGIARLVQGGSLTQTGAMIGTPLYMSPEQAMGNPSDHRADIYALGVMLFEMVTGRAPYQADSALSIMLKHINEPLPDIHRLVTDAPDNLIAVIQRALAKSPADRFQSAGEMAQALQIVAANGDLPTWTKPTPPAIPVITGPDQPTMVRPETPTITKPPLQHYWPVIVFGVAVAITVGLLFAPSWLGNSSSQPGAVIAAQIRSVGPYAIGGLGVLVLFVVGARAVWPRVRQLAAERRKQLPVSERRTPEEVGSQTQVGEMTVHLMAKLKPDAQKEALALIGREHEMRLSDLIVHHGGGRYLLRGFGRFGGTTLINQIIQSAKTKLGEKVVKGRRGLVLAIRVEFAHLSETSEIVSAVVREFRLESARSHFDKVKIPDPDGGGGSPEQTISIKAIPVPGIEAVFERKSEKAAPADPIKSAEKELLATIDRFLDRGELNTRGILERIVRRTLGATDAPVRVIFVIDRIESESVFNALRKLRLFEDERITFFALVRQEHYLKWTPETRAVVDSMGFHSYYVRSLWEDEDKFVEMLLTKGLVFQQTGDRFADFRDHIAYVARGAPGQAVREILSPVYCEFNDDGRPALRLDLVRHWNQIEYNAQRQRLLARNWSQLLGGQFINDEENDQARIGVCEIVDWMDKQGLFAWKQLCDYAGQAPVLIHPSEPMRNEMLEVLVDALLEAGYLKQEGREKKYRVTRRIRQAVPRQRAKKQPT